MASCKRRVALGSLLVTLLAACSFGCAGLAGEQEADGSFPVIPRSDGTFYGWTEITIGADTSDASRATLVSVRLDVEDPSQASDLSFFAELNGEAVTDTERTLVVHETSFPPGQRPVGLDIVYGGDLRPLFKTSDTIRLEWTGRVNPSFGPFPEGGIRCTMTAKVDIE